jgi:flagellar protein FliJ
VAVIAAWLVCDSGEVRKQQRVLGKIINALPQLSVEIVLPRRAEASLRCRGFGEYESMKSRETLIRLKKFQVDEQHRRVAQIESMISEFERISSDLERDVKIEQDRSGIHDPGHFAYPTYAKAAIQRRDNLKRSAHDLKIQLEDAKASLSEAFEEMKKVELLDERDQMRERVEEHVGAQAEPVA